MKTEHCLETQLTEHSKHFEISVVAQHFLNCPHAQYSSHVNVLYDNLHSSHLIFPNIENLVFSNFRILHACKSNNANHLLIKEALLIKLHKPKLNSGTNASKEPSLF